MSKEKEKMGGSLWFLDCTMKMNPTLTLLNEEDHFIDNSFYFFAKEQLCGCTECCQVGIIKEWNKYILLALKANTVDDAFTQVHPHAPSIALHESLNIACQLQPNTDYRF